MKLNGDSPVVDNLVTYLKNSVVIKYLPDLWTRLAVFVTSHVLK
jgi:hypothetical protein